MTIVLPISPILLHLRPKFKCLHLCFRCLGTFWQCQHLRQRTAILNFKMAAICFTLHCISLTISLWKESKDSLYLGNVYSCTTIICGNCHHSAAILEFKMASTLLDMHLSMIDRCQLSLRKLLYLHFVQVADIFNFTMMAALPVLFSGIEHTNITVHVS